jgi:Ca-activated chloride channel family protein
MLGTTGTTEAKTTGGVPVPPMVLMSDEEIAGYGRDPDAGYGALRTDRGLLPMIAMDVDARVAGVIATIELVQQFVNATGAAIEATYIFPLPDRAAVHRFRMEVAGRVVDGVVDERGAARAQYDQAIASGRRAAIAEEERPGVFTLRVGNLPPGETATVRLSLVGPLPVDDGEVTFRFPLVVAPRYVPGTALGGEQAGLGLAADTDLVPDASRISPPVLLPGTPNPVRLRLRLTMEDAAMRQVASSLHAVTDVRGDLQVIEVRPGERLDRDFILRWRIDAAELSSSLVCADDPDGAGGTFALTIVPPSTQTVGARPRDVVLVVDRSGSMDGWKMVAARRAAARIIDTLTSRDRFCALAFDDSVASLLPEAGLVSATDHHRAQASAALARLESRGGTEIAQPLVRALAMLRGTQGAEGALDREKCLVLVTDGQVGNEGDVLRRIAPELGDVRVFTLGIDQAVNAAFLRRLAGAGGGLCELVESEARLDAVMDKVHRRIGAPVVTDLTLRGVGLELCEATLAPARLPDVYAGAPVVVFGRYRGAVLAGAMIEASGESLGDSWKQAVALCRPPRAGAWLAASWARAHLRDLDDRHAAGGREVEPEIVRISKQFGVLSRFTAYVAVDHDAAANPTGRPRRVVQSVELPAGWGAQMDGMEMFESSGGGGGLESLSAGSPVNGTLGYAGGGGGTLSAGPTFSAGSNPSSGLRFSAGGNRRLISSNSFGDGGRTGRQRFEDAQVKSTRASSALLGGTPGEGRVTRARLSSTVSKVSEAAGTLGAPATPAPAHLRRLAALAADLGTQATSGCDAGALRRLRQRLVQWVEDVRSVGGDPTLAAAVEALVGRLSKAVDIRAHAPAAVTAEVRAIADELARLAGGASPGTASAAGATPGAATTMPGRTFWK